MRKIIFHLLALLVYASGDAQHYTDPPASKRKDSSIVFTILRFEEHKADSLKQLLSIQKEDTSKIKILSHLAWVYIFNKPDSAIKYGEQGLLLARRLGSKNGEVMSNTSIAGGEFVKGNYYKAIQFVTQNLRISEEINNMAEKSASLQFLGLLYKDMGDFKTGLQFVLQAKRLEDSLGVINWGTYMNVGTVYERTNQLDSALAYSQKAFELELKQNGGNHPFTPYVLGNTHTKLHNYELAMSYYHIALSRALKRTVHKDVIDSYNGLTNLFREIKQPDSAIYYAKEALKYHGSALYTKGAFEAATALAQVYKQIRNTDSTLKYLELSVVLKDSLYNQQKIMQVQNLAFNEDRYQQKTTEAKIKARKERKENLQMLGIAAFIITFIVFVTLISRRKTFSRGAKYLSIVGLLLVFEFIALLTHPWIEKITHHNPVWMLLLLVLLASILVPVHHYLEHLIKEKLTRNKTKS